MSPKDWSTYYNATRNRPVRPLLVEALPYVRSRNRALDIGGGALNEAGYLLSQGFAVTVVDKSPLVLAEAGRLPNEKLRVEVASFEEFNFGEREYDIASAMFALPFVSPSHFEGVVSNIKRSLVPDGIFCGQLFDPNDGWSSNEKMTFLTRSQVEVLLEDMETIQLIEKEEDGMTATGLPKHWHVFHLIARKK